MNNSIIIPVEMQCTFDPTRREGNSITFMSTHASTVSTAGRPVADIYTTMAGSIEIKDLRSDKTWVLQLERMVAEFLSATETLEKPAEVEAPAEPQPEGRAQKTVAQAHYSDHLDRIRETMSLLNQYALTLDLVKESDIHWDNVGEVAEFADQLDRITEGLAEVVHERAAAYRTQGAPGAEA